MNRSPENLDLVSRNGKLLKLWWLGSVAGLALSLSTAYGGFLILNNTQQKISERVDQEMGAISVSELSQAQTITRSYEDRAKSAGRNEEVISFALQEDQAALANAYALEDLALAKSIRKSQLERGDFALGYSAGMLMGILGGGGSVGSFLGFYATTIGIIGTSAQRRQLMTDTDPF